MILRLIVTEYRDIIYLNTANYGFITKLTLDQKYKTPMLQKTCN